MKVVSFFFFTLFVRREEEESSKTTFFGYKRQTKRINETNLLYKCLTHGHIYPFLFRLHVFISSFKLVNHLFILDVASASASIDGQFCSQLFTLLILVLYAGKCIFIIIITSRDQLYATPIIYNLLTKESLVNFVTKKFIILNKDDYLNKLIYNVNQQSCCLLDIQPFMLIRQLNVCQSFSLT